MGGICGGVQGRVVPKPTGLAWQISELGRRSVVSEPSGWSVAWAAVAFQAVCSRHGLEPVPQLGPGDRKRRLSVGTQCTVGLQTGMQMCQIRPLTGWV